MNNEHKFIADFEIQESVYGLYIVNDISLRQTKVGTPYLRATLSDISGSIEAVFWEYGGELTAENNGAIVHVVGQVGTYKETLQLTVEDLELVNPNDYDEADFDNLVPTAPIDKDAYNKYLYEIIDSMETPDIRAICDNVIAWYGYELYTFPAAKSVHHSFVNGLLMHTVDMLKMAELIASLNPNVINRDLLLGGVILHDIGKTLEFAISPETHLVTGYTFAGNALGHSCLGAIIIEHAADEVGADPTVKTMLQHMVLSHHGSPELGASKVPMILEAEILHGLDMIDSRKQIYAENTEHILSGELSDYIPALGKRVYKT
jgi:3'-5' exoribonuclease